MTLDDAHTLAREKGVSRPLYAVVRAISGEKTAVPEHYMQKRAKLSAEQWSNTFGDRMHGAATLR